MGTREGEDLVAVVAAAEKETDGALDVRLLLEREREAERRGERVTELGDLAVDEGIEGWEPGAGAGVHPRLPLAEGNGDVWETGRVDEGALDMVSSGLDVVKVPAHGRDANDNRELAEAECLVVSSVAVREARDDGRLDPAPFQASLDLDHDPFPDGCDRVGVSNGADYADVRPSLGMVGFGPGMAALVDEGGTADDAMGIGERVCVVFQEAGPLGVGVGVFCKLGGGRCDANSLGVFLGCFAAREEDWVDVSLGHH